MLHTQLCKYLNEEGPVGGGGAPNPQHAAEQLVRYAIDAANSSDNASAVVTLFTSHKPPVPQRPRLFGARRESAPSISTLAQQHTA
jgi:serine/threonine protein phosphatase PrpC